MLSFNRHNLLALVLILLIGHFASTLHVATHIPADQTSCEYCAGNANPAHAIPPSTTVLHAPTAYNITPAYVFPVARVADLVSYRERAPPTPV